MPIIDLENVASDSQSEQERITEELFEYIPPSWTRGDAKRRGGTLWLILSSIAGVFGFLKTQITQAKAQLRIKTASGVFLDLIAEDYFGRGKVALPRLINEGDEAYRERIITEILQERVTIAGISKAVSRLTGAAPIIYEPFNTQFVGAWHGVFNPAHAPASYTQSDFLPHMFFSFGNTVTTMFVNPGGYATGSYIPPGQTTPAPNSAVSGQANPGVGAFGDAQIKFYFRVIITANPRGVKQSTILHLVNRLKAAGVLAEVSGGVN